MLSILRFLGEKSYTPGVLFSMSGRKHVLEMQRDAMRVLKAFMNNDYGVSAVMGEADGVNAIVMQFAPRTHSVCPSDSETDNNSSTLNPARQSYLDGYSTAGMGGIAPSADARLITKMANQVSNLAMEMLSVLCWTTGDSSVVFESFEQQRALKREDGKFEPII